MVGFRGQHMHGAGDLTGCSVKGDVHDFSPLLAEVAMPDETGKAFRAGCSFKRLYKEFLSGCNPVFA